MTEAFAFLVLPVYLYALTMRIISKGMRGSRNFCQGGPGLAVRKQLAVFSPQLILQFYRWCSMVISKKSIIFQGFRGGPTFSMAGATFSRDGGGLNANFYRNPYNF